MSSCSIMTVTYGNRYDLFILGPYKTALENGLELIVVCNGISESYLNKLQNLKDINEVEITLLVNKENLGSAGGFYLAMDSYMLSNSDYFLLLDDDNYLEEKLNLKSLNKQASFYPRDGRKYIETAVKGYNPKNYLAESNSFLGFSISRLFKKTFSKAMEPIDLKSFSFPWAPYGGMILSRNLLEKGLRPNKDFYLYCDDTDFSSRVSKYCGLFIDTTNKVKDVSESWNVSDSGNVLTRLLMGKERWRVYYSVRNQAYFDRKSATNYFFFILNFSIFVIALITFYIFKFRRARNFSLIFKAILNGLKGRLGYKGFDI